MTQPLATRFVETMTLFKDLLMANQELRSEISSLTSTVHEADLEKRSLLTENQDLREQVSALRTDLLIKEEALRSSKKEERTHSSQAFELHTRSSCLSPASEHNPPETARLSATFSKPFKPAPSGPAPRSQSNAASSRPPTNHSADFSRQKSMTTQGRAVFINEMDPTLDLAEPRRPEGQPRASIASTGSKKPSTRIKVGAASRQKARDLDFITFC